MWLSSQRRASRTAPPKATCRMCTPRTRAWCLVEATHSRSTPSARLRSAVTVASALARWASDMAASLASKRVLPAGRPPVASMRGTLMKPSGVECVSVLLPRPRVPWMVDCSLFHASKCQQTGDKGGKGVVASGRTWSCVPACSTAQNHCLAWVVQRDTEDETVTKDINPVASDNGVDAMARLQAVDSERCEQRAMSCVRLDPRYP